MSVTIQTATLPTTTSVPEWDRQFRLVCVDHEHREKLGRLGLAGIGADTVATGRPDVSTAVAVCLQTSVTADTPRTSGRVLEGAIRSQVNDGPVTTYKVGQSFSELPGDRHGVSANASKTKPAKLLAVFVVDTNETELTIPFAEILPR